MNCRNRYNLCVLEVSTLSVNILQRYYLTLIRNITLLHKLAPRKTLILYWSSRKETPTSLIYLDIYRIKSLIFIIFIFLYLKHFFAYFFSPAKLTNVSVTWIALALNDLIDRPLFICDCIHTHLIYSQNNIFHCFPRNKIMISIMLTLILQQISTI